MKTLVSFTITDRPELQFRAFAVDGTEGLSELYKFDIDCFGSLADRPDTLDLVGKRAVLRFELEGAAPREVFGIIKTVTSGAPSMYGEARYRFRLVPWLERLNYSQSNQIHGTDREVSVVDVIEAELKGGLRREARVADTDFRIFEHELRLRNRDAYPKRDHIVQYEETDFAFISRLAEHYGIYYFFEHDKGAEKIVFADDNIFTKPIEGDGTLDWKPWSAGARAGSTDTIQAFDEVSSMIPRRMWVLDYNYRLPHVPLLARSDIDSRGLGNWVEYGSHHRTPAEGETLARIRAEERRSHQRRWTGKSAVARLAPGRSFTLNKHPYGDWNQEYLVVSVHHEVRIPVPGAADTGDWAGYRNSFEAIPQKVTFRPARITPKPRMDGLLNARIDGAGQRDKAELDDQGRYRVRVPFDNSDTPDGKGSQWVRMASPFGGDGDGMHFPLAPDTEVVVACVNGDPNRPVILGAVPNPRTKSVVTRENSLRNRMVTRTGMGLEMGADGGGPRRNRGGGGTASNGITSQSAYGATPILETPNAFGVAPPEPTASEEIDPALGTPNALMAVEDATSEKNYVRVYNTLTGSYLRLGAIPAASANETSSLTKPGAIGVKAATASGSKKDNPSFVAPAQRADTPFDNKAGTYLQTGGSMFIANSGNAGLKSNGEIVLTAASNITLHATGNGAIRLNANGDADVYVGGILNILSNGDINFESKGSININSANEMNIHSGGVYSQDSDDDSMRATKGDTKSWQWGSNFSGIGGGSANIALGSTFTLAVGNLTEISILTKVDVRLGLLFELHAFPVISIENGFKFKVNAAKTELAAIQTSLSTVDARITDAVKVQADALTAHKDNVRLALGELTIGQKKAKIDSVAAVALIV